jgi:FkbM family methyltransferase
VQSPRVGRSRVREVVKYLLHPVIGRRVSYPLWRQLHRISIYGMNSGWGVSNVRDSGELWMMGYLARHLPANGPAVFFDVGANVGRYASQVIARLAKRVRLYCFEPSERAFEVLAQNLGGHEDVQLFDFGFGDKEELVTLHSDYQTSGLASVYERRLDHFGIRMGHAEQIRLRTLDHFCKDEAVEHINFLKLDVEGHELKVLDGAQGLIDANGIDFIQFEFGGCNIDSRTYFQDFFYLLHQRYKIHRLLRDGLIPVETYRETDEIFVQTNYVAISRTM